MDYPAHVLHLALEYPGAPGLVTVCSVSGHKLAPMCITVEHTGVCILIQKTLVETHTGVNMSNQYQRLLSKAIDALDHENWTVVRTTIEVLQEIRAAQTQHIDTEEVVTGKLTLEPGMSYAIRTDSPNKYLTDALLQYMSTHKSESLTHVTAHYLYVMLVQNADILWTDK